MILAAEYVHTASVMKDVVLIGIVDGVRFASNDSVSLAASINIAELPHPALHGLPSSPPSPLHPLTLFRRRDS